MINEVETTTDRIKRLQTRTCSVCGSRLKYRDSNICDRCLEDALEPAEGGKE
jgi:hypothetical protein